MEDSWRSKTVRNWPTGLRRQERPHFPDGWPTGIFSRREFLTDNGRACLVEYLMAARQEHVVLAVRKSIMSSKKNYTCGTTYIKFSLYASSIYMSIIYIDQTVFRQANGLQWTNDYKIYNFSDLQVLCIRLMSSLQKLHTDQYNTRSRKLKFSSPLNKSSISASLSTSDLGLSWKEEFQKSLEGKWEAAQGK